MPRWPGTSTTKDAIMPMKPALVTSPADITRAYLQGLPPGTVIETHATDGTWTLWRIDFDTPGLFPVERLASSTDQTTPTSGVPRDAGPVGPLVEAMEHAVRLVVLERTAPPTAADPVGGANRHEALKSILEAWSYDNEGQDRAPALANLLQRIEAAL